MSATAERMHEETETVLRYDEPMAAHTSWETGGTADRFFEPAALAELQSFLAALPADEPVYFIGKGSNLLVRDGGIRGTVIGTRRFARRIERDGERVEAGASVRCATLAKRCVAWQLGPAAFFAGIPGTVGGALAMNAGAFGGETWESVERVTTIARDGRLKNRARDEFEIGYRSVAGPTDEWFVAAAFRFATDTQTTPEAVKSMMGRRGDTQPLEHPSAGSVFRNPPGQFAGDLIERAGLKGRRLGAAMVSDKHANFIVNTGGAKAEDVENLIGEIRREVERQFGVVLETEVRIVGEAKVEA